MSKKLLIIFLVLSILLFINVLFIILPSKNYKKTRLNAVESFDIYFTSIGKDKNGNFFSTISVINEKGEEKIIKKSNNGLWWPKLSPNGSKIVFTEIIYGNKKIIKNLKIINKDGTNEEKIGGILFDQSEETTPNWLDNERIIFASNLITKDDRYNNIFIYNIKTKKTSLLISDFGCEPNVSNNKNMLVIHRNDNPEKNHGSIWIYDLKNKSKTQLTDRSSENWGPVFSPDNKKIVFNSNRSGNTDLWIMNIDGTNLLQLTNHPADDAYASFSPDGNKIVFQSNRTGNYELYIMDIDGLEKNLKQITFDKTKNHVSPFWAK